jgi:hypothetical protein
MNPTKQILRAYIECALWASTDGSTPNGGRPLDENYSLASIPSDELAKVERMIEKFLQIVGDDTLNQYLESHDYEQLGHDLFLTQNGHGTGFWDRDYATEGLGKTLTALSKKLGECTACVGDDGCVYFYP